MAIPWVFLLPLWLIVFAVLLGIALFVFWAWAIISCLVSGLSARQKIFWLITIVLLSVFGALLYLILSKVRGGKKMTDNLKGKKLLRSKKNRIIAGVCGGLG